VAAELEPSCRVYVPDSTPLVKKAAIRSFGAELIELPFSEILEKVLEPVTSADAGLVHPCYASKERAGRRGEQA